MQRTKAGERAIAEIDFLRAKLANWREEFGTDDPGAERHCREKHPEPPPITPGYPARNIEVNGFRYVLDEKERGAPDDAEMLDWLLLPANYRNFDNHASWYDASVSGRDGLRAAMQQKEQGR